MPVLPDIEDAEFNHPTDIDNPYFPLPAGTINSYGASTIDPESGETETERSDQFATFDTKLIEGIETLVVRDTEYEDGVLAEDTLDFYAQDSDGNVWYLGEISISYDYDDDGNFAGTDFDGSWQFGVAGALPGWIMEVDPTVGDSYFQEFFPGIAVDEGEVVATGLDVEIDSGEFEDVIKILDTSALEPGAGDFKYFAPGIGMVLEEEGILPAPKDPELVVEIENIRVVDDSAAIDPAALAFEGDGTEVTITFLTEDANANGAVGAYFFDPATGEIGEGRILFANTEDAAPGDSATINVPEGQSLGLFLIPDADDLGIELEDYIEGGLFFRNFLAGDIADLYDGDPSTTYAPGVATIDDGLAPLVTDADGNILPIRAFHSVGNRDGFNFLNPVAGENALASDVADDAGVAGVEVVSFEKGLASTEDYDGDFNDAFVAVSAAPLGEADLAALLSAIGISRIVGSGGNDMIEGTEADDQVIGLEGNDRLFGGDADDVIEASDGNDRAWGGAGDDAIFGEDGNDRLFGEDGADEIDGGDGNDWLAGGDGDDLLEGGAGADTLDGGAGYDTLLGGEGKDALIAGADGARMAGGQGNDTLIGESGEADYFVFGLIDFGNDLVFGFEDGTDIFEIAIYTEVAEFADIEVSQLGNAAVLSFAGGSVKIDNVDAALIDASDFVFV
jgi:Ca2+-binding RTX toxin-like protein